MSRSGYSEDLDHTELVMWRGAVASAIGGKRGQALLAKMREALDAMDTKQLVREQLVTETGAVCALGAVGVRFGVRMDDLDPEERHNVAIRFNIAEALAAEIAFVNDEEAPDDPVERWQYVRKWVERQLVVA